MHVRSTLRIAEILMDAALGPSVTPDTVQILRCKLISGETTGCATGVKREMGELCGREDRMTEFNSRTSSAGGAWGATADPYKCGNAAAIAFYPSRQRTSVVGGPRRSGG